VRSRLPSELCANTPPSNLLQTLQFLFRVHGRGAMWLLMELGVYLGMCRSVEVCKWGGSVDCSDLLGLHVITRPAPEVTLNFMLK
jgi:hypothetical protein